MAGLGTLASLLVPDVRAYRQLRDITQQLTALRGAEPDDAPDIEHGIR